MTDLQLERKPRSYADLMAADREHLCAPDPVDTYSPTGTAADAMELSTRMHALAERPAAMHRWAMTAHEMSMQAFGEALDIEAQAEALRVITVTAAAGELIYVAPDICETIAYSAETYPEPVSLDPADYGLGPHGIVCFGRAVTEVLARYKGPGRRVYAGATGLLYSSGTDHAAGDTHPMVTIAPIYTADAIAKGATGSQDERRRTAARLSLKYGPVWPAPTTYLEGSMPRLFDRYQASKLVGDVGVGLPMWPTAQAHWYRVLFALFEWMGGIAEVTEARADAKTAKRHAKAVYGIGKLRDEDEVPAVRYVKYRRSERARNRDADDYGGETGRRVDHRYVVGAATGGFWRRYWTGPKDGEQVPKLNWIMPYVAGPEGTPLIRKRIVRKAEQ